MIHLFDLNEEKWMEIIKLRVGEGQQKYLNRPIGIIARGYIYRNCNACVLGNMRLRKGGPCCSDHVVEALPDCLNLIYLFL